MKKKKITLLSLATPEAPLSASSGHGFSFDGGKNDGDIVLTLYRSKQHSREVSTSWWRWPESRGGGGEFGERIFDPLGFILWDT